MDTVHEAGCDTFIVHARKAWLTGLSPKQNREIPPLHYDYVYRIRREFPDLEVILNGGVPGLDAAAAHLDRVDGVMIGRAAYRDPWMLAAADGCFFGEADPVGTRTEAVLRYLPYVAARRAEGVPLHAMTRHILGLFNGCRGARQWRRYLSENAYHADAGPEVIESALAFVEDGDTERGAAV